MKKKEKNNVEQTDKKMITEQIMKKSRERRTKAAISFFVLLLAIGVGGNWYWENSDISTKISTVSENKDKVLGEATYVDATTKINEENEYFSNARVERQSSRDASLESLQKIVDSADESDEAHKKAAEKIAEISEMITTENKIETLVTAKGINNCLAIINKDGKKIDIIVDTEDLNDTVILQIKEIATSQVGCSFSDVTIIQAN